MVCTLSLQKLTQKPSDPSFFLTNTTALHHGDWLGHITSMSNISLNEAHTSSRSMGDMHLNHSLKGLLSVMQISCLVVLMQPSSFPSNVKMLWKARTSSLATTAFQGVQLLRPSRFNFSSSPSCCTVTYMGSCTVSAPKATSISGDTFIGINPLPVITHATCTPFFKKMGDTDIFQTSTDTLLLLILSLVYACRTCNPGGKGCAPCGWNSLFSEASPSHGHSP